MSKKQPSSDKAKKLPGKKEENPGQKGFKKFFKGDNAKSSGFKGERPERDFSGERSNYKRSSDKSESSRGAFRRDEKSDKKFSGEKREYKRSSGNEGESSRGAFRRGERPEKKFSGERKEYKRSSGNESDSYQGTFHRDERPERKFSGERKEYKRSSDNNGGAFHKDGRPERKFSGERKDYKRSPDNEAKPFAKKKDRHQEQSPRPNRYAHVFGKLDDEELAAHQQKLKAKKEEREKGNEVSFSKSLEKWEDNADDCMAKESKPYEKRREADTEGKKERHNKKDKFRRNFDYEQDYEKAYAAKPDGSVRKKKMTEQEEDEEDDEVMTQIEGKMPLNKYIAHCDVCSRRDAVALIKDGKVKVNGIVVKEPGYKVAQGDEIALNDKKLAVQKNLVYILLNKPKGYITTTDDPKGRKTVMDIVENYIDERVFPIGRLDRNTTGLLLLTNDGELAQKLSHPKYEVRKVYQVKLDKAVTKEDFEKIVSGLTLEDGPVKVDAIEYLDSKDEIGLEIHSGKNRIVRRIFESLGYDVEKLDRVMYAGLTKKNVLRGKWRFLTKQEVINLKHFK